MRWKHKIRNISWANLVWNTCGYILLFFLTALFSMACLMGRQMAAVNCLIYCTVLLYILPPHKR